MNTAWQTTNTKLAACLGALRFPIRTQVTQEAATGQVYCQFFIGERSVSSPEYLRDFLLLNWKKGTLEKESPLHPFLQGHRCEHNYEMLLDAQKQQRRIRLVGVGDSHATEYRDGEELPEMINAQMVFQLADLSLVAALGTLGVPCIKMEWNGKFHVYTLPVEGHYLRLKDGTTGRYNGINLSVRAEEDSSSLLLWDTDPLHPLCAAYNTRKVSGQLRNHLKEEKKILLLKPPGSGRSAMVSENATGRVYDIVRKHFKA